MVADIKGLTDRPRNPLEEDALEIGSNFVQELRDLGAKYQLTISPAAAARFYAEHLQTMVLRKLHERAKNR